MTAGSVSLVGAGPGDPGLITRRGLELLRAAQVVVHDRLVGRELLLEAPPEARLVDAGKAPGRVPLDQVTINDLLIAEARSGHRVVRLKGGDPFVFGRGFEELLACREAGVRCEVVPGVSSAIAGPAAAGIPVTLRGVARSFAVMTAQTGASALADAQGGPNWPALARTDTLVILMGGTQLKGVRGALLDAGRSPQTPVAIVESATLPRQRVTRATLATLGRVEPGAGAPAVLVVGEVARFARTHEDGESRALTGRRVVVTRPLRSASAVAGQLRRRGAEVIVCPLIRIEYRKPRKPHHLEREIFSAAVQSGQEPWIVFTSRHGVVGFWAALRAAGGDARSCAGARLAVVGPRTGEALGEIGLTPDLVADPGRAEALIEILAPQVAGAEVLFPCGTLARREVAAGLRAAGAKVRELVVYNTLPERPDAAAAAEIQRGVDAVLFHSPSAVRAWVAARLAPVRVLVACLGEETADVARRSGLEPEIVAEEHSDDGLIAALEAHFAPSTARSQASRT
ncbi:MAG: uroporphyrinogen-III C-methyltransferase [Acidobacteriota bacterium]